MLEIKPIADKSAQKALAELCGVPYLAAALAYSAYDGGAPVGICQFRIIEDAGHIYQLCNTIGVADREALIIMGRATLNFIDLCGVHEAYYEGDAADIAKAVGFRERDGRLFINLEGVFESHCKPHQENS